MATQDHLFIELGASSDDLADSVPTAIAAVRTTFKGRVLGVYGDRVKANEEDTRKDSKDFKLVWRNLNSELIEPYEDTRLVTVWRDSTFKQVTLGRAAALASVSIKDFLNHPSLDVMELSWPLVFSGLIPSRNLVTLCDYFRASNPAPGSASGDCEALVKVYFTMMDHYSLGLRCNDGIREIGGQVFDGLRQMFKLG